MASSHGPETQASWRDLARSGHAGKLVLLAFGVWLHAGDELMVASITPQIVAGIGGQTLVAWLTALYEVGSIAAGAASALIVLRLGLRRAMALAALAYLAGCVVSAAAPVMPVMLAGRLLQGMGGGALVAMSLIGAWRLFPDRLLGRVIAAISAVWGISAFAGPLFGALLAQSWGWPAAFAAFAFQAALFAAAVLRFLPEDERPPAKDTAGFPAMRIAILSFGVIAFAASGITGRPAFAMLLAASGLALIGLFAAHDQKAGASRLLPLGAANPATPAGAALLMVLALSASTIAFMVYAPVFLAALHGMSAVQTGLILTLESVGWTIAAMLVAGLPLRFEKAAILGGYALSILSIAVLAFAVPSGAKWLLALCAAGLGGGFGIAWTSVFRRAAAQAAEGDSERVTSAISTIQRLGYALGAAYSGIIVNQTGFAATGTGGADAAKVLFLLCLIPAAIGYLAAMRFVSFKPGQAVNS